jgi:hypothetical protein
MAGVLIFRNGIASGKRVEVHISDVAQYCRSCHICQVVGKPNQKIPPAPLLPIPEFEEPYSTLIAVYLTDEQLAGTLST